MIELRSIATALTVGPIANIATGPGATGAPAVVTGARISARPTASSDMAVLEPPRTVNNAPLTVALHRMARPLELISGDPAEIVGQLMSLSRAVQIKHCQVAQEMHATTAQNKLDEQHEALEEAREAAESGSLWETVADVAAVVGAVVGAAASVFTGGASLVLTGLAIGCMIGSKYSGEIAKAFCDLCGIDGSSAKWIGIALTALFAAGSIASGYGAASAAGSVATGVAQTAKATAQVITSASQVASGVARGGQAICGYSESMLQIDAEVAHDEADQAQHDRDATIDALRTAMVAQARDQRRVAEMQGAAHEARMEATGRSWA